MSYIDLNIVYTNLSGVSVIYIYNTLEITKIR